MCLAKTVLKNFVVYLFDILAQGSLEEKEWANFCICFPKDCQNNKVS